MTLIDHVLRKAAIDRELLDGWLTRHKLTERQIKKGFVIQTAKRFLIKILFLSGLLGVIFLALGSLAAAIHVTGNESGASVGVLLFCGGLFTALAMAVVIIDWLINDEGDRFKKFLVDVDTLRKWCSRGPKDVLDAQTVLRLFRNALVSLAESVLRAEINIVRVRRQKKVRPEELEKALGSWRFNKESWQHGYKVLDTFGVAEDPNDYFMLARANLSEEEQMLLSDE